MNNNEMINEDLVAQKYRDIKQSLDRLRNNPDFKKVFLDFYIKEWRLERASLLATGIGIDRTKIMEHLIAVANFENFMITVDNLSSTSNEEIDE